MAVPSGGLVNVRIRGDSRGNTADIPSLWFQNFSNTDRPLQEFAQAVKWWIQYRIAARMASAWELLQVEAYKLGGMTVIADDPTVPGGPRKLKAVREKWTEKYIEPGGGIRGAITTRPMPSFVAYGVRYSIRVMGTISMIDGHVISGTPEVLPRAGGCRIPGVPEAATGNPGGTEDDLSPDRLTDFYFAQIQAYASMLVNLGFEFVNDLSGPGEIRMCNVSKQALGKPRVEILDPSDPTTWTVNWVVSEVTGVSLNPGPTSQVSRKKKRGRLL